VLYEAEDILTPAVTETTAYLMASMLADVVDAGTGARVRREGFTLPAAGKTGTTNEFKDSWFIGFTPKLATGVWVGFDQPQTILPGGFSSEIAVPMWARFMKEATRGDRREWLSRPKDIVAVSVCRLSGGLPTEGCERADAIDDSGMGASRPMIYTEYFAKGTEPARYCHQHPTRGLVGTIASWFKSEDSPAPPRAPEAAAAPAAVPDAPAAAPPPAVAATETAPPQQPERRRGFWSRVFGIGGNDRDRDNREPERNNREQSERDRREQSERDGREQPAGPRAR
jgi:penicillin-binding protein 1A